MPHVQDILTTTLIVAATDVAVTNLGAAVRQDFFGDDTWVPGARTTYVALNGSLCVSTAVLTLCAAATRSWPGASYAFARKALVLLGFGPDLGARILALNPATAGSGAPLRSASSCGLLVGLGMVTVALAAGDAPKRLARFLTRP